MKTLTQILLLSSSAILLSACVNLPQKQTGSPKKLKLETVDHGPMRPKTYLYREVDDPAAR